MITVRILDTPVKLSVKVLPPLLLVWGVVIGLGLHWHPARGVWQGLLIGTISFILLSIADFGHPLGHLFSAHYAGAPMDEILISSEMPRTLYQNNDVAPAIHRMRALGGPIFNVVGLLLSLSIFQIASGHPVVREWMGWSTVGHGYILVMSLLPLPIVDGGTILKWTLVARGKTETEADDFVRRVDWVLGIIVVTTSIGLLLMRMWIIGLILLAGGGIIFGIRAGKIR